MSNFNLHNRSILVIEDNQVCLALIKAFFKNTGAVLILASNGKEGWQKFIENNVDLVLTDLRLPDTEGLSLVKEMKRIRPDTPIIIQTACTIDISEANCLESGCEDYIVKPYPRIVLLSSVNKALENKKPHFLKTC